MPQLPSSFIPDDTQPEAQPVAQPAAPKQSFSTLFNDPERQIKAKPQPAPPAPKPTPSPELPNPRYAMAEHMKPLRDPAQPILDLGGVVTRGGEKAKAEHPDMSDTRRMLIDMGEAGAEVAGSLTSPANLVLMASGIGEGSTLIRALMNVGFKASMAWSAADNLWKAHKAWKAYKASGDKSKLDEAVKDWTASGINSLFLGAGGREKESVKAPPAGSIVSEISREGQKRLPGAPPTPVEAAPTPPAAPPEAPGVPRLPGVVAQHPTLPSQPATQALPPGTIELPAPPVGGPIPVPASTLPQRRELTAGTAGGAALARIDLIPHEDRWYAVDRGTGQVVASGETAAEAQAAVAKPTAQDHVIEPEAFSGLPKSRVGQLPLVRMYADSGLMGQQAFDQYLKDILPSRVHPQLDLTDFTKREQPNQTAKLVSAPSIKPKESTEAEAPKLPEGIEPYAGAKGLKHIEPTSGMVVWTQEPDSGKLEPVEIIRPEGRFDQYTSWRYRWLGGPDKGREDVSYSRSYWQPEAERSVGADLHPAAQPETRQEPIREAQTEPVVSAPSIPTAPVETTPEFRDWRPQGRTIRHSTPGQKLSREQAESVIKSLQAAGGGGVYEPEKGIVRVTKLTSDELRDLEDKSGRSSVREETYTQHRAEVESERSARQQARTEELAANPAVAWIDATFGNEAMNSYNKLALAKFLTGEEPKFEGLIGPKWIEGVTKARALEGNQVNWKALKQAYEQSSEPKPVQPSEPPVRAIAPKPVAAPMTPLLGGELNPPEWATPEPKAIPLATSNRMAGKQVKVVDDLLVRRAVEKAAAAKDEWNFDQFKRLNPKRLSQADRDLLNLYIFGTEEGGKPEELLRPSAATPPKVRGGKLKYWNVIKDGRTVGRVNGHNQEEAISAAQERWPSKNLEVSKVGFVTEKPAQEPVREQEEAARDEALLNQPAVEEEYDKALAESEVEHPTPAPELPTTTEPTKPTLAATAHEAGQIIARMGREKVDKKTGLTKSQKEFLSAKLAAAAEQLSPGGVAAPKLPVST